MCPMWRPRLIRMMAAMQRKHDVVVVGARVAGASTAMLLARGGHDVVVVDRSSMPSDTVSTHAFSRGGVVQLDRWDLLDDVLASGAPAIRTVSFHTPTTEPVIRTVKHVAGIDLLLAPRRYILDDIVLGAAREAGAAVRTGVTVTGVLTDDSGRVRGVHVRDHEGQPDVIEARFVVGADGVRSRTARAVGATVVDERPTNGALHYIYVAGLDAEGFEFHTGDRGMVGVLPTHGQQAAIWIGAPADRVLGTSGTRTEGFLNLLGEIAPNVADRVRTAQICTTVRGAVRLPNHVLQGAGRGWALVGDAGYHRDPLTGHGMTDAFRDAELAATHIARALRNETNDDAALAAYDAERRRALLPIFDVTCAMADYPPMPELIELQRSLGTRIDEEARWLAAQAPVPSRAGRAAA